MRYDDIIRSAEIHYATPLLVMSLDMFSLIYNRFEQLQPECFSTLLSDTLIYYYHEKEKNIHAVITQNGCTLKKIYQLTSRAME